MLHVCMVNSANMSELFFFHLQVDLTLLRVNLGNKFTLSKISLCFVFVVSGYKTSDGKKSRFQDSWKKTPPKRGLSDGD